MHRAERKAEIIIPKALRPGVELPPAARHFEKTHMFERISSGCSIASGGPFLFVFKLICKYIAPGVALPPAARYFEKRHVC